MKHHKIDTGNGHADPAAESQVALSSAQRSEGHD